MTGYVYFLRPQGARGPVKIGHSRLPVLRLNAMMTWSPTPLEIAATVPATMKYEHGLHGHFAAFRSHGEWFHENPELTALIEAVQQGRITAADLPFAKRPLGMTGFTEISRFSLQMGAALRRLGKRLAVPEHIRLAHDRFSMGKYRNERHRHPADARVVFEFLERHNEAPVWPAALPANDTTAEERAA